MDRFRKIAAAAVVVLLQGAMSLSERRGAFYIELIQGLLKVETKSVSGRAPLGDGDTIEMGESRFVFKCVTSGHVGQSHSGV